MLVRSRHAGEDISGRFDYLFEPLDGVESAGDDDTAPLALAQPDNQNRSSNRIVLAGVVLATIAATTAAVVALLQPAQPAQQTIIPTDATPVSPTMSTLVSTATSAVTPTTTAAPAPVRGPPSVPLPSRHRPHHRPSPSNAHRYRSPPPPPRASLTPRCPYHPPPARPSASAPSPAHRFRTRPRTKATMGIPGYSADSCS